MQVFYCSSFIHSPSFQLLHYVMPVAGVLLF